MLTYARALAAAAAIPMLFLASCSDSENALRSPRAEDTREFSEQNKIAARALSIGNNQTVAEAETPYARALLCRHGIGVIADRVRQSGGFGEEQMQAFELAIAHFDRRLRTLAEKEAKSASEIRGDLAQTAIGNPDVSANARIAIGCLRRLQQ